MCVCVLLWALPDINKDGDDTVIVLPLHSLKISLKHLHFVKLAQFSGVSLILIKSGPKGESL